MTDEVRTTERDLRHYAEKMLCGGGNSVTWQRCQAVAKAYLAARADTGGERERACEVCSENMAMCQMLRPDDDRKMCLTCFLERTEGGTDTPAATQPTPASREEKRWRCPNCFRGDHRWCRDYSCRCEKCYPTQPTPAACQRCGGKGYTVEESDYDTANGSSYRRYACPLCQPTPAADAGDAEYALIDAEPWRQGYVGTFPELCSAYGRACSAISAFEDDASIPLDEHIAALVKRLAAAETSLGEAKANVTGMGELCDKLTNTLFERNAELTRRRAVPAEVANEVREAMNDALAEEAAYDISYIPPRTKRAAVLASYIRTLAAGEAAEHE